MEFGDNGTQRTHTKFNHNRPIGLVPSDIHIHPSTNALTDRHFVKNTFKSFRGPQTDISTKILKSDFFKNVDSYKKPS